LRPASSEICLVKSPLRQVAQYLCKIAIEPRKNRLRFRVAKAAIEFEHLRPAAVIINPM